MILDPEELLGGLAGANGLVLAISGGPDSTALMVLAAGWTRRPPVLVVSVDHGLRPEALHEAESVRGNAVRLGLTCRIMRAAARPSGGNLQDWARRERYRLLAEAAAAAGCDTIVTAHHRDDQAETFLLRLARGSGVYGLGAMAPEGNCDGLRLARPLLDVPRAALAALAAESGLTVATDPSNEDPRFDRVRMRALMPALAETGLTAPRLAATAAAMRRAAAALDHYVVALIREHFHVDPTGAVAGSSDALARAPEEVGLRALALMLKAAGGAAVTPSLDGLRHVHEMIAKGGVDARLTRTLHGAVVAVSGGQMTLRREWGRSGPPSVDAPAGLSLVWDARFKIQVPQARGALSVGPLGRASRRLRSPAFGPAAMRVLPGLFRGGDLLAVPRSVFAADDGEPLDALAAECLVGGKLGLSAAAAPARSP